MRSMKRILSLLLALVLVAGYLPGKIQVRASQEDGLCPEHHAQHNEDCGDHSAALKLELEIKALPREEKLKLTEK